MAPRSSSARLLGTELSAAGTRKRQIKRVLVVRGGAIGDFVLTLPALRLIRDDFPHAHLEILGYKHIVALGENRFYANAARSIEYGGLASFFARESKLPTELADYFGSFNLIVSYLFDPNAIFQRNVGRCGGDNFLACSPKISGEEHASIQLARPLERLGLVLTDHAAKLYPSEVDRDFARRYYPANATIAVHPGSGSVSKNWPLEHWLALLNRLLVVRADASFLIVGGEADGLQLTMLRSVLPRHVSYAESITLVTLAAVLEQCVLFIGHDSGISHIAAAVGTPCVLLYGTTNPAVWAPANANVRLVQSPTGIMRDISVDKVLGAASAGLKQLSRLGTDAHRH